MLGSMACRSNPSLLALALALAGCQADTSVAPKVDAPLKVSVVSVGQQALPAMIEAAGTAALRKEIPLGFTSPGRIARVMVQEGDVVRAGQVLAVLDTTSLGASLAAASAESTRAKSELERFRTLYAQGWLTKSRLEAAEAAARSADANVSARRFAVDTARVVAPSGGIVLARTAEPSQIIDAGTPIVTLGDSASGFVLRALLTDRDAVRIKSGIPAEVSFDALPGVIMAGRVIEMGGRSDRGSGAFVAEIALPPDSRLRSGLVGKARIAAPAAAASAPALVIPPTALFAVRADEGFVYVVGNDRKVRARKLALGPLGPDGSAVLSGLSLGETVVTSSLDRLREGSVIDPVRATP
jgi:RND family efflux transporter MFP subunit